MADPRWQLLTVASPTTGSVAIGWMRIDPTHDGHDTLTTGDRVTIHGSPMQVVSATPSQSEEPPPDLLPRWTLGA